VKKEFHDISLRIGKNGNSEGGPASGAGTTIPVTVPNGGITQIENGLEGEAGRPPHPAESCCAWHTEYEES